MSAQALQSASCAVATAPARQATTAHLPSQTLITMLKMNKDTYQLTVTDSTPELEIRILSIPSLSIGPPLPLAPPTPPQAQHRTAAALGELGLKLAETQEKRDCAQRVRGGMARAQPGRILLFAAEPAATGGPVPGTDLAARQQDLLEETLGAARGGSAARADRGAARPPPELYARCANAPAPQRGARHAALTPARAPPVAGSRSPSATRPGRRQRTGPVPGGAGAPGGPRAQRAAGGPRGSTSQRSTPRWQTPPGEPQPARPSGRADRAGDPRPRPPALQPHPPPPRTSRGPLRR